MNKLWRVIARNGSDGPECLPEQLRRREFEGWHEVGVLNDSNHAILCPCLLFRPECISPYLDALWDVTSSVIVYPKE